MTSMEDHRCVYSLGQSKGVMELMLHDTKVPRFYSSATLTLTLVVWSWPHITAFGRTFCRRQQESSAAHGPYYEAARARRVGRPRKAMQGRSLELQCPPQTSIVITMSPGMNLHCSIAFTLSPDMTRPPVGAVGARTYLCIGE